MVARERRDCLVGEDAADDIDLRAPCDTSANSQRLKYGGAGVKTILRRDSRAHMPTIEGTTALVSFLRESISAVTLSEAEV